MFLVGAGMSKVAVPFCTDREGIALSSFWEGLLAMTGG